MLNNIHHATVMMAGPTITKTITISAILSNNHLATVMMADPSGVHTLSPATRLI